jgi:hypothetical protein
MSPDSIVEIAHRRSRKRAILFFFGTLAFVLAQALNNPFTSREEDLSLIMSRIWLFHVVLLLACLGTGGGLLTNRRIRALVNDEVSRMHYQKSVLVGFWVAMITALSVYLLGNSLSIDARQAVYLLTTITVAAALFTFSWLEYRVTSDG